MYRTLQNKISYKVWAVRNYSTHSHEREKKVVINILIQTSTLKSTALTISMTVYVPHEQYKLKLH